MTAHRLNEIAVQWKQTTRRHTGDNTPLRLTPADMQYQRDFFFCDIDPDPMNLQVKFIYQGLLREDYEDIYAYQN